MSRKLTYEEVKEYIEVTSGSGCKLLSTEYVNIKETLSFECECGEGFETTFDRFKYLDKRKCDKCGKEIQIQKQIELKLSDSYNFAFFNPERAKYWDYEKNKDKPEDCTPSSTKRRYFICENGHSFKSQLSVITSGCWCDICSKIRHESRMASTIKLICKEIFPNTIWEARLGAKHKKELPYDIYIPELNLIIECQSEYHDRPRQKKLDKIKKQWAIDNGYEFVTIDHRDYAPLEAIQLFFPWMKEIPEYVDINKNTIVSFNLNEAQELLDTGLTYKEVADSLNVKYTTLKQNIAYGNLIKPNDYINISEKREVIQIDLNGRFISEYGSIHEAMRNSGVDISKISDCINGNRKSADNCIWMCKKEYLNLIKSKFGKTEIDESCKHITILDKPYERVNKKKAIVQLDLDNNFVAEFESTALAEKVTGVSSKMISKCITGYRNKTAGFKWLTKSDYLKLNNENVL